MSIIYINGEYLNTQDAKISVFDRSFLFGEGLFESFRSYDGQIPFLQDHINRLEWSSTFLNITLPESTDYKNICETLLKKNDLTKARFKILLSSNHDTFTNSPASSPTLDGSKSNIIVFCEQLNENNIPEFYKLKTIKSFRNDPLPIAAMKTTNYLVKSLAKYETLDAGFNDGILLNSQGKVTETCNANIFWVDKDARLWAIMEEQGLLCGIMQKKLLEVLDLNKLHYKKGVITPQELSNAREVFITNSIIGIKPVIAIDKRQISGGEIGSITAMITDLWSKYLKSALTCKTETR